MSDVLETILTNAKFRGSEAKAYLAVLQFGNASLLEITKISGLSKTTAFDALESLRLRKIITISHRKNRVIYRAVPPERIIDILRDETRQQTNMIDDVARALPFLQALHGNDVTPTVIVKEGNDAVYGFFEHLEKSAPNELVEIANMDEINSWIDTKTHRDAQKSYKWMPKKSRVLMSGNVLSPKNDWNRRKMNKQWGIFHGNLAVYSNHVSIVTFTTKLTLVIIESKALADSMRLLFEVAWRGSDEIDL